MKRLTIKRINAALLAEFGEGLELVRGNGYYYFAGIQAARWQNETGVYGADLKHSTLEFWIQTARERGTK